MSVTSADIIKDISAQRILTLEEQVLGLQTRFEALEKRLAELQREMARSFSMSRGDF